MILLLKDFIRTSSSSSALEGFKYDTFLKAFHTHISSSSSALEGFKYDTFIEAFHTHILQAAQLQQASGMILFEMDLRRTS
jgi:hypothetical protein